MRKNRKPCRFKFFLQSKCVGFITCWFCGLDKSFRCVLKTVRNADLMLRMEDEVSDVSMGIIC